MLSPSAPQNRHERRTSAKGFPPPEKQNFTIPEIRHVSGIGRTKIYDDIRTGRLVIFKVGRRTLVAAADLSAWLASYRNAA